jgi:ligand-binding sensor domain-containing protein
LAVWGQNASQPADFNARLWQAEDGLPNNIVQAIVQTRDSYLWIGTREGLAQFDGDQFHLVDLLPQSFQPSVTCLLADPQGDLWIGTEGFGSFCLRDGKMTRCKMTGGNDNYDVTEIQQSSTGTIWFGTSRGIYRWTGKELAKLTGFKNQQAKFCADNTGKIWLCDGSLKQIDPPEAKPPTIANGLPRSARSFYCDAQGTFWIGTDYGTANSLIQVKDGVTTSFHKEVGPAGFVSVIFQDSLSDLWIGSYSGLSRFLDGKFIGFQSSYRTYCVYEDWEHNLWVGSEEGLTRLTPKKFKSITTANGLSLNTVVSICQSRDGGVWIGTWGGGVNHYLDGRTSYLNQTDGLKSDYIMGITEAKDGSLWAGTDYGGPLQHIQDGKITIYGRDQGFNNFATVALCEDETGRLWIGGRSGLDIWNGTNFTRFTTKDGLSNNSINAIIKGSGNDMWIGTDDGLTRWHDGKFENLAAQDQHLRILILSLYQDANQTLWIGTKRQGLLRLHDGMVNEFNRGNGLFSDAIYSILEDDHTNLWLNSSRGIFRVNKQQIQSVVAGQEELVTSIKYGRADGIVASGQFRDVTQPAACKDLKGRLWFRTTRGVVTVDPESMAISLQPPPVVIQEVTANNKQVVAKKLNTSIPRQIIIPPGPGNLEINYVALSYRAPEKNQYRYRLSGVDNGWINAGNGHIARYNNLPPGKYRFQVIACNNDGIWNKEGQTLELVFQPHFWQTWWFLDLISGVVIGLVAGIVRYITRRRMQRKLIQLEQRHAVERERARIARDVHDELGSKLTQISFQGSIAQCSLEDPEETRRQIEKMSASAREAVSSLQEIIWAADPENDSLEGMVGHLSHYATEFFGVSGINCEVVAPEHIPDRQIPAVVRHNLFLAMKEAINNSAKHAHATRINIRMLIREDLLEIVISDNGTGFATEASTTPANHHRSKRTGHGLINMQARLKAIDGRCEISSEASQGTTIRFLMPLKSVDA